MVNVAENLTEYKLDPHPGIYLEELTAIWYRRVRSSERPEDMDQGVYDFCLREARSALLGLILSKKVKTMSPPSSIWSAEHKVLQLTTARDVGLQIPETIVTNEPGQIVEAFKRFRGKMIIKPVRSGFVDYGTEQHAVFTSQVLEEHLQRVSDARWSPAIYQPLIPKQFDVRVTVVGSQFFIAEIDSQSDPDAAVDWRHTSNPRLPHRKAAIPGTVEKALRTLLDALQLKFAAIDLILTPAGEYVFLEVNPNGQWLWLDDFLNLGISQAVAEWLSHTQGLPD
jgi:glutathione synthase/RimK-type ligase-like ATP-grasp enzyme